MARSLMLGLLGAALGCTQTSPELSSSSPEAMLDELPSTSPAPSSSAASEQDDSDGDGFVSEADACPDMPEDLDGDADEDGCPDLACRLEACRIALLEPVYFEPNEWELAERSHPMLEDVAWLLQVRPELTVELRGHRDSEERHDYSLELSQRRADSVRRFLIERGVASERMTSVGYGDSMPIDTNRTEAGRANNRRVEVLRTDSEKCRE